MSDNNTYCSRHQCSYEDPMQMIWICAVLLVLAGLGGVVVMRNYRRS